MEIPKPKAKYGEAKRTVEAAIGCVDVDNCIPWLFATNRTGQPIALIDGSCVSVRRYVYSKSRGLPADDLDVTTTCGDRRCVNPNHLTEVTHPVAIRGVNAKLSDDDVRAIRELRRQGVTLSTIAKRFNCSRSTISYIGSGKNRKQVV